MSRRGWMLFLAMGVIWGVPYLLIKVAVDGLTPASLVLVRTSAAALILLPLTLAAAICVPSCGDGGQYLPSP
jgi:drug/metabolite transporter (DMT)-like permease